MTPSVLLDLFIILTMAVGAMGVALILGAAWAHDEKPPPLFDHTARNAFEAFAMISLSTMIAAMVFVLIPILFVLTPFLMLAAWTLLEPPPYVRYA